VLVIGTGLLGTSIGLALRRLDVDVQLDDANPETLAAAVARGAGTAVTSDSSPALVVIAVPPSYAGAVMAHASHQWPNATVTDVTSVKALPLEDALSRGADPRRLVGGHPMAGREVSGPAGARVDLFADRPWVVTPLPESSPSAIDQVRALAEICGGLPREMSPAAHDRAVALTSHVPQVVASLVAARLGEADPADVQVSGQGLRDVTRIAGSDPALWVDILGANAVEVSGVLERVAADLEVVVTALKERTSTPIDDLMRRGNIGYARVPGKHGQEASTYARVLVMVADEPGELARLFVAAGEAGINLEDVRIDHVLGRPSGLIELTVRPERGDVLRAALRDRGFDLRD
jgi:prephenate dehydrogenase